MLFVANSQQASLIDAASGIIHRNYRVGSCPFPSSLAYCSFNNLLFVPQTRPSITALSPGTMQPVRTVSVAESIASMAVTNCGTFIVGGGSKGTVFIWASASGQLLYLLKAHVKMIMSIAFSDCSSLLATASEDSTCRVWQMTSLTFAKPQATFSGHSLSVNSCTFLRYAPLIATASSDQTCRVFEAMTGTQLLFFQLHAPLLSMCLSEDDHVIIAGGEGGKLHFASLYAGPREERVFVVAPFSDHSNTDIILCTAIDSSRCLTVSKNGAVLLWDIHTHQVRKEIVVLRSGISSACRLPQIDAMGILERRSEECLLGKVPVLLDEGGLEQLKLHNAAAPIDVVARSSSGKKGKGKKRSREETEAVRSTAQEDAQAPGMETREDAEAAEILRLENGNAELLHEANVLWQRLDEAP